MSNTPSSPHLSELMGGYFHQDYDYLGQTDEEILREYAVHQWPVDLAAAITELDAILQTPLVGILQRYDAQVGGLHVMIGEDDASARDWLVKARAVLADAQARSS